MKCCRLFISILALLFLIGCASDEGERVFEEALQQRPNIQTQQDDSTADDNAWEAGVEDGSIGETEPFESPLSGTLNIMTHQLDTHLRILAEHFIERHPDVAIEFEEVETITDIAQQAALTTRLLANPPDIFNTAHLVFEQVSMDALFIDLNELIDGATGINRADYFDNIFRGAEIDGNLYHVPLMISTETALLNKRYFEEIGVRIDDMRTITLDQYIDFHQQAAVLFPEDDIFVQAHFNVMEIFRFERVYDLETGIVSVNTPEMRSRLELVNSIPVGPDVTFMPDEVVLTFFGAWGPFSGVDSSFIAPKRNYMYHFAIDLMSPFIFFMQDHPQMRFSHPVHRVTGAGEIRFHSSISPAIMRDSPNHELAWEFIRFCMEFSESLYLGAGSRLYAEAWNFPVNRTMFDNHLYKVLNENHSILVRHNTIPVTGDEDIDTADKEARIEYSIYRYTELIEMLNFEARYSQAVMNSLIYPDIYLFVTGRQDVYRTLANIQNRLELYVAE